MHPADISVDTSDAPFAKTLSFILSTWSAAQTVTVALIGATFRSGVLPSHFEPVTTIPDLTVSSVSGASSGSATAVLTLSFTGKGQGGRSSIFVKLPKTPQTLNLPRFSQRRAAWAFFFLPVSSQIMPKSAPGTVFCHEILDFDLEASRHGGCSSIFVKILEASQTVPHFSQGSAASCRPGHPHTQLVGQNPRPERRFVTKLPISALKRPSLDLNYF